MIDDRYTEAYEAPVVGERETITYEWDEDTPPTTAVIEAIAAATNRDPRHMSPLHDYVDVDSLDGLVTAGTKDTDRPVWIIFPYRQHTVLVESTGTVEVRLDTAESE